MVKQIVGGVITLVIGGTVYSVSQSSITNNFAKNTGLSQQQAQQYIRSSQKDLQSFSKIGKEFTADGNSILGTASQLDCANYSYTWETAELSCADGQTQLQTIGNDEETLGNCYSSLGTNLSNNAKATINNCMNDIDTVDADYNLPVAADIINASQLADFKNANLYNKSVLQSALQASH